MGAVLGPVPFELAGAPLPRVTRRIGDQDRIMDLYDNYLNNELNLKFIKWLKTDNKAECQL